MSDCSTLWAAACEAPLFMGFFGQEYWSGLPCTPPGDLPDPGIEPRSPALQVDSLLRARRETHGAYIHFSKGWEGTSGKTNDCLETGKREREKGKLRKANSSLER